MGVREKWTEVKGVRVHYWVAGHEDNAVILIHGGGFDNAYSSYGSCLSHLAPYYTVYAPDLPGYGSSGDPPGTFNTEYYSSFIKDFIDGMGMKKVCLVGSSMGGGACLSYCLENPDRVAKLVLVCSHGLGKRIPLQIPSWVMAKASPVNRFLWWVLGLNLFCTGMGLKHLICYGSTVNPEMVVEVRHICRNNRQGNVFRQWQKTEVGVTGMKTDFSALLEHIQCPTLLIHGANDKIVPVSWSVKAASKIPGAKLHIIEKCGHWLVRECVSDFSRLVNSFLEEQNTGRI